MEVNFFGNIAMAKAVLPIFRQQKSGQILVISSIAGKFGFHLRSAYSASKHALFGTAPCKISFSNILNWLKYLLFL